MKHSDIYHQDYDQFEYYPVTVFAAIIGSADPHRTIKLVINRSDALAYLIRYLNMMMDEDVLPKEATEDQVRTAFEENLYQPIEIVECYADNLFGPR